MIKRYTYKDNLGFLSINREHILISNGYKDGSFSLYIVTKDDFDFLRKEKIVNTGITLIGRFSVKTTNGELYIECDKVHIFREYTTFYLVVDNPTMMVMYDE